ncbi:helix-turn-helix domain-containing protein [Paenibacillus polymyxa]|uniref:Helix-turn-helix domain-containing protein n=1 Tax=Paenibacillus polymyxa TaxID=1406 RepID=A0AAE9IE65_PAEPO|nr:helix-turn-helix domain-containing protein [Paenibacillus polymyxa]URJ50689.1 helix-turn-helix domain-containing protein [Paenibacillus polymyxa]
MSDQLVTFLKPTLDVVDAADYLLISKYTVINRIKQGKLKAYKQGRHWKIKREWLLEYEQGLIGSKK